MASTAARILIAFMTFQLVAVMPLTSRAETLEIPLEGLVDGNGWQQQVLDFDAGGHFIDLTGVSFRLVGECGNQSYIYCGNSTPLYCCDLPSVIHVILRDAPGTPDLDTIIHSFPDGSETTVTLEWNFDLVESEDLAGIADGNGRIIVDDPSESFWSWDAQGWICPAMSPCVLESATVIFEFGSMVAVEQSTWGAIKAIYR